MSDARDVPYLPASALEVVHYEPEQFKNDVVEDWLDKFDELFQPHLESCYVTIISRWDDLVRERGASSFEDAASRGLLKLQDTQPIVDEAKAETVDAMEADGTLLRWTVDERDVSPEERREWASMVIGRYLRKRMQERRASAVIALQAGEVPAGATFHRTRGLVRSEKR